MIAIMKHFCRGLFLFNFTQYSSELNHAETLLCILKGKWVRPDDYHNNTKDYFLCCKTKILSSIGNNLFVN